MRYLWIILITAGFLQADYRKLTLLERMVQPKVTYSVAHLGDAALTGETTSVVTRKQSLRLNNAFASFGYSRWDFAWRDADRLSFGNGSDPLISHMERLQLSGSLPWRFDDRWFWLNLVSLTATYEAEMDDALSVGLFSFVSYKIDDDHTLQFGLFSNYHSVASIALPALSYSYRSRQTDGFQAVLGFPRSYVGYYLSERLLLNAGVVFSQAVIRLADDNALLPGGYLEVKDYLASAGVRYDLAPRWQLQGDLLYGFSRSLKRYDADGRALDETDVEGSPGVMLKLRYLFEEFL